jgi:hypothetical protein
MEEIGIACKVLIGIPEGNRPPGRPRRGWEGIIKMDFGRNRMRGCGFVWHSIEILIITASKLRFHSFSKRTVFHGVSLSFSLLI